MKPGWLKRQLELARKDVQEWPEWMKNLEGIKDRRCEQMGNKIKTLKGWVSNCKCGTDEKAWRYNKNGKNIIECTNCGLKIIEDTDQIWSEEE